MELDILYEFLKIESISAQNKQIEEAKEFLLKLLSFLGFKVSIFKTKNHPIIYAERIEDSSFKTILFYNHYDVQPPDPYEEWICFPFSPYEKEGRIFARGVADNKGDLIARILAIKLYLEKEKHLSCNIKFIIEGEEEIGSPNLEEFIKNNYDLLKADLCIWEGSNKDEHGNPVVALGCKGILTLELEIEELKTDLHSSLGSIVPNSCWILCSALNALKDNEDNILIENFYEKIAPLSKEEKEYLTNIPFYEKEKLDLFGISKFIRDLEGEELKEAYFYHPALNINGLIGGYQKEGVKTILPKKAIAKLDFRLVPYQTPEEILSKLRAYLDKYGFNDVKIKNAKGYPAAKTPIDHPYVKLITSIGEKIYDQKHIIYPLIPGSGPIYLFAQVLPCISIGIGDAYSNIHAANESIKKEDFFLGVEHIYEILKEL